MFEAAKDNRGRWGVFDTKARVWYYSATRGERAARKYARDLNAATIWRAAY